MKPSAAVIPYPSAFRASPQSAAVVAWRKSAETARTHWLDAAWASPEPEALVASADALLLKLRRSLRSAEVFPPTLRDVAERRRAARTWTARIDEAAHTAIDPVLAVDRVVRLWIALAQRAAWAGDAATLAA